MGKLFDDRGNVMSPSYSTKKGVRYRFYVSSALLRGRKAEAGSVGRVSAVAIEDEITRFVTRRFENDTNNAESFRDLLGAEAGPDRAAQELLEAHPAVGREFIGDWRGSSIRSTFPG